MRYAIPFLFVLALGSCDNGPQKFHGFLVAREWFPEHMSNQSPKPISYAGFVPPLYVPVRPVIVPHPPPPPHKVHERWVWHIANKDRVVHIDVRKEDFFMHNVGDTLTVTI